MTGLVNTSSQKIVYATKKERNVIFSVDDQQVTGLVNTSPQKIVYTTNTKGNKCEILGSQ